MSNNRYFGEAMPFKLLKGKMQSQFHLIKQTLLSLSFEIQNHSKNGQCGFIYMDDECSKKQTTNALNSTFRLDCHGYTDTSEIC